MNSASPKPLAVVVGFIGKLPYAGMSLYNLHYIAGLHELGYDVHYVERLNKPDECYDPVARALTDNPTFALSYLAPLLARFGLSEHQWTFIDRSHSAVGYPEDFIPSGSSSRQSGQFTCYFERSFH